MGNDQSPRKKITEIALSAHGTTPLNECEEIEGLFANAVRYPPESGSRYAASPHRAVTFSAPSTLPLVTKGTPASPASVTPNSISNSRGRDSFKVW